MYAYNSLNAFAHVRLIGQFGVLLQFRLALRKKVKTANYKISHPASTTLIPRSQRQVLAAPLFPVSDPRVLEIKLHMSAGCHVILCCYHVLATLSPRASHAVATC